MAGNSLYYVFRLSDLLRSSSSWAYSSYSSASFSQCLLQYDILFGPVFSLTAYFNFQILSLVEVISLKTSTRPPLRCGWAAKRQRGCLSSSRPGFDSQSAWLRLFPGFSSTVRRMSGNLGHICLRILFRHHKTPKIILHPSMDGDGLWPLMHLWSSLNKTK